MGKRLRRFRCSPALPPVRCRVVHSCPNPPAAAPFPSLPHLARSPAARGSSLSPSFQFISQASRLIDSSPEPSDAFLFIHFRFQLSLSGHVNCGLAVPAILLLPFPPQKHVLSFFLASAALPPSFSQMARWPVFSLLWYPGADPLRETTYGSVGDKVFF